MDIDAFLAAHSDNDDNGGWEREAFDNDTTSKSVVIIFIVSFLLL